MEKIKTTPAARGHAGKGTWGPQAEEPKASTKSKADGKRFDDDSDDEGKTNNKVAQATNQINLLDLGAGGADKPSTGSVDLLGGLSATAETQ